MADLDFFKWINEFDCNALVENCLKVMIDSHTFQVYRPITIDSSKDIMELKYSQE